MSEEHETGCPSEDGRSDRSQTFHCYIYKTWYVNGWRQFKPGCKSQDLEIASSESPQPDLEEEGSNFGDFAIFQFFEEWPCTGDALALHESFGWERALWSADPKCDLGAPEKNVLIQVISYMVKVMVVLWFIHIDSYEFILIYPFSWWFNG